MDIWEIYHNSFARELNSDEIDFLDTMIRKYPYFAVARFLKAKAVPTTYNIALASSYAPNRPLFKAFLEGEKNVREPENLTVMDKRETSINIPLTQQKHQLFSMTVFLAQKPAGIPEIPFSVLTPCEHHTFQGFLDFLIKEKVEKYKGLPQRIRKQMIENLKLGLFSNKSKSPQPKRADDLIQRFLDNNPKIKRPELGKEKVTQHHKEDKSINLDEEIVSETLAKIHLKQNNTAEALRIYRKLSLLFPEKSAYFDAQISEITHI